MPKLLALAAGAAGLWTATSPWLLGWRICGVVYLTNVVPGLLSAALATVTLWLGTASRSAAPSAARWLRWAIAGQVLAGSWLLVSPLLVGYAIVPSLFACTLLPGLAILWLALLSGYMGFKAQR